MQLQLSGSNNNATYFILRIFSACNSREPYLCLESRISEKAAMMKKKKRVHLNYNKAAEWQSRFKQYTSNHGKGWSIYCHSRHVGNRAALHDSRSWVRIWSCMRSLYYNLSCLSQSLFYHFDFAISFIFNTGMLRITFIECTDLR